MHILLTNDDGINAEGIQVMREVIKEIGKITLVAPEREKSASGHGITMHKPLRVDKINYEYGIEGYKINGNPADCVKLAVEELMPEVPDLIISGINSGPNLATDVLYSGTVSAAIEGIISEVPSIAVSLVLNGYNNYYTAANFLKRLAPAVVNKKLPNDTVLNVNVPDYTPDNIKGYKITSLGVRKYLNNIVKRKDPRGKDYYWLGGKAQDFHQNLNSNVVTDLQAVSEGYISVTPIHFDLTNHKIISELQNWSL